MISLLFYCYLSHRLFCKGDTLISLVYKMLYILLQSVIQAGLEPIILLSQVPHAGFLAILNKTLSQIEKLPRKRICDF